MSSKIIRPPYIVHDNNPEKKVPEELFEQFFQVIKGADINEIRDFSIKNKVKFSSMLEKKTNKTPFHIVLELDEKVADPYIKLELLKYLSNNGAPTDSPDSSNVRPIHLAAQLQDPDIIDFMINQLKLDPSTTDSSNNSALHYAVRGAEIACPSIQYTTPGSLIPSQKIDKEELSVGYKDAVGDIVKLLSTASVGATGATGPNIQSIQENLIHIINTIMKIPQMYENTEEEKKIQTRLVEIFSDVGFDPNYSGELTKQQSDIENLIQKKIELVEDNIMHTVNTPLVIVANNSGWGPTESALAKILPNKREEHTIKMKEDLEKMKQDLTLKQEISGINEYLSKTADELYKYIDLLIFGETATKIKVDQGIKKKKVIKMKKYGSDVTNKKMFVLLMYGYIIDNHKSIFVDRIMDNSNFMANKKQYQQYLITAPGNEQDIKGKSNSAYLYKLEFGDIIQRLNQKKKYDIFNNQLIEITKPKLSPYIGVFFNNLFLSWLRGPNQNKIPDNYFKTPLNNLQSELSNTNFNFKNELVKLSNMNVPLNTNTWFTLFHQVIKKIYNDGISFKSIGGPRPGFAQIDLQKELFTNIVDNEVPPGTFTNSTDYTYIDIFRTFDQIRQALNNNGSYDKYHYPYVFNILENRIDTLSSDNTKIIDGPGYGDPVYINTWVKNVDDFYTDFQKNTYPILIFCEKMFYRVAQIKIEETLNRAYDALRSKIKESDIPLAKRINKQFNYFNQDDMYTLILPYYTQKTVPEIEKFKDNRFRDSNIFKTTDKYYNELIKDPINKNIKNEIINCISCFFNTANGAFFSDTTTNNLREGVERIQLDVNCSDLCKLTMGAIEKYDYVNNPLSKNIKQMYKTFINDRTINFKRYSQLDLTTPLSIGVITDYMGKLSTDGDKLSYVTEITVYYFTYVLRKFNLLIEYIDIIYVIINDIMHHIELGYEYFVPQVLLPALVRQVLIIINKFHKIKKYVDDHIKRSTQIGTKIDFTNKHQKDIMELSDGFNKTIINVLETTYVKILSFVSYHNNVIDYLHQLSASKLIDNINNSVGPQPVSKIFLGNLSKISEFPGKMTDAFDIKNIQKILEEYKIGGVKYFFGNDLWRYYTLLGKESIIYDNPYDYYYTLPQTYKTPAKGRRAIYYRNIMDLHRVCTNKNAINSVEQNPLRIPEWEKQLINFLRTRKKDINLLDSLEVALVKYGEKLNDAINDWTQSWENDFKQYMYMNKKTLDINKSLVEVMATYSFTTLPTDIETAWKKSNNPKYWEKPQKRPQVVIGPPFVDNWQMIVGCDYTTDISNKCAGSINISNSVELSGSWLSIDATNPSKINFCDAFIKIIQDNHIYNFVTGMPSTIKPLLNDHLVTQKQRIIEDVIQYVINNRSTDKIAKDIYDKLLLLANETTYDKIDPANLNDIFHVKAYVLIGKIVDTTVIEIIKFATKQSVHNWIYSEIKNAYQKTTNVNIINIINQNLYSKISPGDVEKNIIKSIYKLKKPDDYIFSKIKIPQVEPDVTSLNYFPDQTKPPKTNDSKLVSYLYNINYFSSGAGTKPKCYNIDIDIAEKLINSKNINLQNSDGQTALHFAVQMHHPDLVDILIERGAKPFSFKNTSQKTSVELSREELVRHLELVPINSAKISDFVGKFATPFNELLVARLLDEKYNNNIIRNIKFAIPISLCIYQQMFYTYLQNYKFGISPDLKDKINKILYKYNSLNGSIYEYPVDLFEISQQSEMNRIIEYSNVKNQSKKTVNKANDKKIKAKKDLIKELEYQIDGLTREKELVSGDKNKINVIDTALNKLITLKNKYELNIKEKLEFTIKPYTNKIDYDQYVIAVSSIKKSIDDRSRSVTQFYDELFRNRISRTNNELHFGIWLNYMDKPLNQTPSMIFLLINEILDIICKSSNVLSPDTLDDLATIEEFMQVTRSYIDRREELSNNLDDNPVNSEDKDQIVFLVNLILTPAVYNIILGQIDKSLTDMDTSGNLYATDSDKEATMKEITETKFGTYTIETYLRDKLPTLAFKYYSQIYQNGQDPDRKILLDSQLFTPILSIIKSNKKIIIDDDSTLITNFNNYLIPFMLNTYQNFIHHIRLAIFGFEKYLLNTYQLVKIYSAMMKKK